MTQGIREGISRHLPILVTLLVQSVSLAFFLGVLNTNVSILQVQVQKLEARFASSERVEALECRVTRIDDRVYNIEKAR